MTIDDTALRATTAPAGYALAATLFGAALAASHDPLAALVAVPNSVVDLTIRVASTGPSAATRLLYRDDQHAIAADGPITHAPLTTADVVLHGLVFEITVNSAENGSTGVLLETLAHEFGVHAAPWGDYLVPMLADGSQEPALAAAMTSALWGGNQHTAAAQDTAVHFTAIITAIEANLSSDSQHATVLTAFREALTRDLAALSRMQFLGGLRDASAAEANEDNSRKRRDEDDSSDDDGPQAKRAHSTAEVDAASSLLGF
jgi:hypothetical protein